jgi:hypothetical protein
LETKKNGGKKSSSAAATPFSVPARLETAAWGVQNLQVLERERERERGGLKIILTFTFIRVAALVIVLAISLTWTTVKKRFLGREAEQAQRIKTENSRKLNRVIVKKCPQMKPKPFLSKLIIQLNHGIK